MDPLVKTLILLLVGYLFVSFEVRICVNYPSGDSQGVGQPGEQRTG